ncbi:MAG TPA: HD domain-containing phosphohydrolase [Gemmatimonadales bacterium]|nr:HD domain-containing phosphohydrolase [Gemmatimonadales bacterium]
MLAIRHRTASFAAHVSNEFAEFEQVKRHVVIGSQILAPLPHLGPISSFVRSHHERWDGQGYPDGLAGEAIPWGARLIGAAEIYDALTTARPYREPLSSDEAVTYMGRLVDVMIAPAVHEALRAVVEQRLALVFLDDSGSEARSHDAGVREAEVATGTAAAGRIVRDAGKVFLAR